MALVLPFHASQLRSLAELVEEELERQILAGEIASGDRINELALSRRIGVSRGPIREALQSLRRAGLVEFAANRGAVVRSLSAHEALDLYDLRSVLFAVMAERAAEARAAAALKALEANIAESERAVRSGSGEDYYALNLAFHDLVAATSGMRRAVVAYKDTVKEMHLFRRRGLIASAPNRRQSLTEHRAIVAAIRRRDCARAFAAARAHILSGKRRFAATLGPLSAENARRDANPARRPRTAAGRWKPRETTVD
jgi:DNA-binding GntR family transcriptional regulator